MKDSNKIAVPKKGWQKELAQLAGCTPRMVRYALYSNARGVKSERVRKLYRAKYCNGYNG